MKKVIRFLREFFLCSSKKLEIRIKELDLELTNAKNRDMKHLNSVAVDILGCDENIKNPLTKLYITINSVLDLDRIMQLDLSINMDDPFTIYIAMDMANKGFNNKHIINKVLQDN